MLLLPPPASTEKPPMSPMVDYSKEPYSFSQDWVGQIEHSFGVPCPALLASDVVHSDVVLASAALGAGRLRPIHQSSGLTLSS